MNLDSLNKWLMLVANVGVIAGIFFLGIEINQNRELMQAQIRHELSQGAIDTILREAVDLETAAIYLKGVNDEPLSPEESFRYFRFNAAWFRYIEDVFYQYRNGLYDASEYEKQINVWKDRFDIPSVVSQWCGSNQNYSDELVQEINRLFAPRC